MCRTTFLSRRSGGKATVRRPLPDRSSYAALFALSSLVYEQLLSRLAQAFVVRSAVRRDVQGGVGGAGRGGAGTYPIVLPIRRYDSALRSCQSTSAAQRPDASAEKSNPPKPEWIPVESEGETELETYS